VRLSAKTFLIDAVRAMISPVIIAQKPAGVTHVRLVIFRCLALQSAACTRTLSVVSAKLA